jgi:hypothetical protein
VSLRYGAQADVKVTVRAPANALLAWSVGLVPPAPVRLAPVAVLVIVSVTVGATLSGASDVNTTEYRYVVFGSSGSVAWQVTEFAFEAGIVQAVPT